MEISGAAAASSGSTIKVQQDNGGEDGRLKNIQRQMDLVKEQLKRLDENDKMDAKQKAELQKQYKQQLTQLESQLTQRKQEIKLEKAQENSEKTASAARPAESERFDRQEFSSYGRKMADSLIAASVSFDHATSLNALGKKLKGESDELKMQIKTDAARGRASNEKAKVVARLDSAVKNATDRLNDKLEKSTEESGEYTEKEDGSIIEEKSKSQLATEKEQEKRAERERARKEKEFLEEQGGPIGG